MDSEDTSLVGSKSLGARASRTQRVASALRRHLRRPLVRSLLAFLLVVVVWASWVFREPAKTAWRHHYLTLAPGGKREWQVVTVPTEREKRILEKMAAAFGWDYPFSEQEAVSVERRFPHHWSDLEIEDSGGEDLHVTFHPKTPDYLTFSASVRPDGHFVRLWGDSSTKPCTDPEWPGDWKTCPEEKKDWIDGQVAPVVRLLTSSTLSLRDTSWVEIDKEKGTLRAIWQRKLAGVSFENDRYYFVFRIPEVRLEIYSDTDTSRVVSSTVATLPQPKAENKAWQSIRAIRDHSQGNKPLLEVGYTIDHTETGLRYVNPGDSGGWCFRGGRYLGEDEAVLAYVVTFWVNPPPEVFGMVGHVMYWIDAEKGTILGTSSGLSFTGPEPPASREVPRS